MRVVAHGSKFEISEAVQATPLAQEVLKLPVAPVRFKEGLDTLCQNLCSDPSVVSHAGMYRSLRNHINRVVEETSLPVRAALVAAFCTPTEMLARWTNSGPQTKVRLWPELAAELKERTFSKLQERADLVHDHRIGRYVIAGILLREAERDPRVAEVIAAEVGLRRHVVDLLRSRSKQRPDTVSSEEALLRFQLGADLKVLRAEFAARVGQVVTPWKAKGKFGQPYSDDERQRLLFLCRTKLHRSGTHAGEPDWKEVHRAFVEFSGRLVTVATLKDFASSRLHHEDRLAARREQRNLVHERADERRTAERDHRRQFRNERRELLDSLGIKSPTDPEAPFTRAEQGVARLIGRGVYPFTPAEDKRLLALAAQHGSGNIELVTMELNAEFSGRRFPRDSNQVKRRLQKLLSPQASADT